MEDFEKDLETDLEVTEYETSEAQIVTWRTLIDLVRENPILYEKKHKGYNKKSDKYLIWTHIGALLVPPMIGLAAEKEFYRLRQKFGKERRKVLQSQARSGADGNDAAYKSNWILYNDLMFLVDHIQSRQTTSNYQRSKHIHNKASNLLNSLASQRLISILPSTSSQSNSVSNSLASQQLISTLPCTSSQSNSDNSSDVLNMVEFFTESSSKDEEVFSKVNSKDLSSTLAPNNLSILSDNASVSVLKAAASIIVPKKQTPPLDIKKRKRGLTDEEDTGS